MESLSPAPAPPPEVAACLDVWHPHSRLWHRSVHIALLAGLTSPSLAAAIIAPTPALALWALPLATLLSTLVIGWIVWSPSLEFASAPWSQATRIQVQRLAQCAERAPWLPAWLAGRLGSLDALWHDDALYLLCLLDRADCAHGLRLRVETVPMPFRLRFHDRCLRLLRRCRGIAPSAPPSFVAPPDPPHSTVRRSGLRARIVGWLERRPRSRHNAGLDQGVAMDNPDTFGALPADIPPREAARLLAWRPRSRRQLLFDTFLRKSVPVALICAALMALSSLHRGLVAMAVTFSGAMLGALASSTLLDFWLLPRLVAWRAGRPGTRLSPWRPARRDQMQELSRHASDEPWLAPWLATRVESLDELSVADAQGLLQRLQRALAARDAGNRLREARAPLETAIQAARAAAALSAAPAPVVARRRA